MIDVKKALDTVLQSSAYSEWHKNNRGFYLCSFFRIVGENEEDNWQIDFYEPKSDTITSFIAADQPKLLQEGSKIFKSDKQKVNELDINKVKIGVGQALLTVDKLSNSKYKDQTAYKKIVILQNSDRELWNITYITRGFNIINVKIDAKNGKILSEEMKNAFSFKQK